MIELHDNLFPKLPEYFYRVTEFVTTFEMDAGKNEPFSSSEDFKENHLLKARDTAEAYYQQRRTGMENGNYFLPLADPANFELGNNAAYSIILSLVEYYSEDRQSEYPLNGEDEGTMVESREYERLVFKSRGMIE